MSITKNRLVNKYTTLPNAIIIDKNVTETAFRVYCYLISKPSGWQVLNSDIQKQLDIKTAHRIAAAWKNLIKFGWITRKKIMNEQGKFAGGYNYELNEYPIDPTRLNTDLIADNPQLGEIHNADDHQLGEITNQVKPAIHNNTDLLTNTDININTNKINVYDEIIDYFNNKLNLKNKKYQRGSDRQKIIDYIRKMLNNGDTVQDIKYLIDYKISNPNTRKHELAAWINTEFVGRNLTEAKEWVNNGRLIIPKFNISDKKSDNLDLKNCNTNFNSKAVF